MDVMALFSAVQTAYTKMKEREDVRDQAHAAFTAAQEDYVKAVSELNQYRAELNDILGTVTPDPRVRIG